MRYREGGEERLGKIPNKDRGQRFSSHPWRMAYFTMSIRPRNSSFRMAFALWASTVLTLSDSWPAISLLLYPAAISRKHLRLAFA